MSTHNICFHGEIRKISTGYPPLSRPTRSDAAKWGILFATQPSIFRNIKWQLSRVVEISNFITCPRTSKWSKSTCPTKIYLLENWHFFLFLEENICCG